MLNQIIEFLKSSETELIAYSQQNNSAGKDIKLPTALWDGRLIALHLGMGRKPRWAWAYPTNSVSPLWKTLMKL